MDQSMSLRAGVIGCGRIGSLWDESLVDRATPFPKTHALAYLQNIDTKLSALCDIDLERARTAAGIWHCDFYTNRLEEFLAQKPDLISVCVPVAERFRVLAKIAEICPASSLLIEKPFAEDLSHGRLLKDTLKAHKGKIMVNYSRRFAPGIRVLKSQIAAGEWGQLQTGSALYGNGLLNNGSHMLDLIVFLLGKPTSITKGAEIADGRGHDPTLNATLEFRNGRTFLQGIDHRDFTMFELDLIFTRGRVRLRERGFKIETQPVIDDPLYPGFKIPGDSVVSDSGLNKAMSVAIAELSDLSEPTSSSIEDALQVSEMVAQIRGVSELS